MTRRPASAAIRGAGAIALAGLLAVALLPRPAAACDFGDFACPVDVAGYSLIVGVTEGLWTLNRTALYAARAVEGLRTWLLESVLTTALDATIAGVRFPFWIAVGAAWIVFVFSFLIQMVVEVNWVNLRRGLRNALLALLLFEVGSQAMAGLEAVRIRVGQGFSAIAGTSIARVAGSLDFYAGPGESSGDGLADVYSIYDGADSCPGVGSLARSDVQMFMNDYIAVYLYADARDIHCPPGVSFANLPARFLEEFEIQPIDSQSADQRLRLTNEARAGLARQAQAVLPAIGAVLEQVMHLVFALALAAIWFSLVISTIFSLFVPTEGQLKTQIDAMLATLKASWLASFWVGIGLSTVAMSFATGNALAVNAVSIGMFVVFVFQIRGAGATLASSVATAGQSLGQAPAAVAALGGGLASAGKGLAGAAVIGAAMATGHKAELAEAGLQQAKRRLSFNTSGNLLAQAGQRLVMNKLTAPVERWVQDEKDDRAIQQREREAAWYEERLARPETPVEERARARRRTDEIDEEITGRQEATAKRQLQQARAGGAWARADQMQQRVDAAEIDRLERQIAEARASGDPAKQAAVPRLQARIDWLRGAAASGAARADATAPAADAVPMPSAPPPLVVGLQEVGVTRSAGGQLAVNGHPVTAMRPSADGHQVTLAAGGRAIDISRESAEEARQLRPGAAVQAPANVRDPHAAPAPQPAAEGGSDARADLARRVEDGLARERELAGQRDVAVAEHRFGDARALSEQINAVRAQVGADRKALHDHDRAHGAPVRVAAPAAAAGGDVALSPSAVGRDERADAPPPAASGDVALSLAEQYQRRLQVRREVVEQHAQRLAQYQQQQVAHAGAGRMAEAQALNQQIAHAEHALRLSQERYNQAVAATPAGVPPAPPILVGEPGFVPAPPSRSTSTVQPTGVAAVLAPPAAAAAPAVAAPAPAVTASPTVVAPVVPAASAAPPSVVVAAPPPAPALAPGVSPTTAAGTAPAVALHPVSDAARVAGPAVPAAGPAAAGPVPAAVPAAAGPVPSPGPAARGDAGIAATPKRARRRVTRRPGGSES